MKITENISDEQLMGHVQQGAEWAFNALYERYSQRILYFMYKMLRQDEAKAQDLLQDVFLKIVEAPEKFDVQRSFKTWIFTVAANSCKNYFRAQKGGFLDLDQVPDLTTIQSPIQQNSEVFQEKLSMALDELPYVYKEAFVLKYKEGLSLQEIALVMDCPLGTVKSRLSSATKLLGKRLAPFKASLFAKD